MSRLGAGMLLMCARIGRLARYLLVTCLLLLGSAAWAHKPSDALLTVSADRRVTWEIALRDLEVEPGGLDDGDGMLRAGELAAAQETLYALARARLHFAAGGQPCTQKPDVLRVSHHSDGAYASLGFILACADGPLSLDYSYLFDADPQHRLIVHDGAQTAVLTRSATHLELSRSGKSASQSLLGAGVQHILEGLDHLLFLLALLLPAVLVSRGAARVPAAGYRPVLREVVRIVTAFTLAHSLTLSLAALGVAVLPARLVEPAIALSVLIAAALNLVSARRSSGPRWPVAYVLGLLHGYGLSSTLDDAGLRGRDLVVPLVTFNLGVELGQLAVVMLVLPLLFLLRGWRGYQPVIDRRGSVVVALLASAWFVERVFDVTLW